MIDTPTRANQADFKQRYTSAYGWFINDQGKKILVYLNGFRNGLLMFTDKDGVGYNTPMDSGVNFEFIPVTKGWFPTSMGAVFMTRIPARQYCRAINSTNTAMFKENKNKVTQIELNADILDDVFGSTPTIQEMFAAFDSGENNWFVLSRHFLVTTKNFYFNSEVVGTVKKIKGGFYEIVLDTTLVIQEVRDQINRNNLENNFKVSFDSEY